MRTWTALQFVQCALLIPESNPQYLAQNVDVVVVVLVLLLVLVVEDHFLLRLVDCRLEDLVRPWVFLPPVVLLGFVLEVMPTDIRITI